MYLRSVQTPYMILQIYVDIGIISIFYTIGLTLNLVRDILDHVCHLLHNYSIICKECNII